MADNSNISAEPELTEGNPVETDPVNDEAQALLSEVYRILRDLCDRIESVVGVG